MKKNILVILIIFFIVGYQLNAATPTINWATYVGGNGNDIINVVATDHDGNIYVAGNTTSKTGISSQGAFRTAVSSCFMAKFNSSGARQWSTYFGYGLETINGLAVDKSGNVFAVGETSSDTGIATKGAYHTAMVFHDMDASNAFIAKFNGNGKLVWATYYGGGGNGNPGGGDRALAVATDVSGNVYIGGQTGSRTGIATSGAFLSAGSGFLAKFDVTGQLLWGTYYSRILSLSTDQAGNVYVGGDPNSLSKFNGNGTRLWVVNHGDLPLAIATDQEGNIYATGNTRLDTGIATAGAYQTSFSGGNYISFLNFAGDAFLEKFNTTGTLLWSTYFGGSGVDAGLGINVDSFGAVYVAGVTSSKSGIASNGAYQISYASDSLGSNAFLAKFSTHGTRIWSTYFGGRKITEANGIAVDGNGNTYISGYTNDTSDIATSGVFQTLYGGGNNDAFLASFNSPNSGIEENSSFPFLISVFPNPFQNSFTLQYSAQESANINIILCDLSGKQIYALKQVITHSGTYSININLERYYLTKGIYVLKLTTDKGLISEQLVKM